MNVDCFCVLSHELSLGVPLEEEVFEFRSQEDRQHKASADKECPQNH